MVTYWISLVRNSVCTRSTASSLIPTIMQTDRSRNATMDVNREFSGILREVVQFLECLAEAKLSVPLETIRDNLLIRSKQTLTMLVDEKIGAIQTIPEPYLNMSPAAPKGLVTVNEIEAELEEYVGAEKHPEQKHQDYYESFEPVESNHATVPAVVCAAHQSRAKDEKIENRLLETYANLSTAQAKSKCVKCGPLHRKEGKKLFGFRQYRTCWVGLIESYLLFYGNDRDNRPYVVLPIHGYMARAAPNAIPKDQQRSESTFEIFCPGSRTLQFVATTPKDMEQWVAKICEMGNVERNETADLSKTYIAAALESIVSKVNVRIVSSHTEEHQNVGCTNTDKTKPELTVSLTGTDHEAIDSLSKNARMEPANPPSSVSSLAAAVVADVVPGASSATSASTLTPTSAPAPSLPARIPRRLPSLPTTVYISPEEEEDDMYYRIEDFKDTTHTYYNNVPIGKVKQNLKVRPDDKRRNEVRSDTKDLNLPIEKLKRNSRSDNAERSTGSQSGTTYDNDNDNTSSTTPTLNKDNVARVDQEDKYYDDVESLLSSPKLNNERLSTTVPEKAVEPAKSPDKLQKKSFLDRVRSLKESPRKSEKKITKRKITAPPVVNDQQSPTYDDISALTNARHSRSICSEEESEYTCPPPPRPIYVNPPIIVDSTEQQELYDDVNSCRINYKEQETLQPVRGTPRKLNCIEESARRNFDDSAPCINIDQPKFQTSLKQLEHYQTPRVNSNQRECSIDQQEELYDDVTILAEFIARQKEFKDNKDVEETNKAQVATEKKSWNRFVGGKKSKSTDSTAVQEVNPRNWNGIEHVDELAATRRNTFQKLINKMENSLGKASVKTSTMLPNKTNTTDNV